jgi:hypothetical protein
LNICSNYTVVFQGAFLLQQTAMTHDAGGNMVITVSAPAGHTIVPTSVKTGDDWTLTLTMT